MCFQARTHRKYIKNVVFKWWFSKYIRKCPAEILRWMVHLFNGWRQMTCALKNVLSSQIIFCSGISPCPVRTGWRPNLSYSIGVQGLSRGFWRVFRRPGGRHRWRTCQKVTFGSTKFYSGGEMFNKDFTEYHGRAIYNKASLMDDAKKKRKTCDRRMIWWGGGSVPFWHGWMR